MTSKYETPIFCDPWSGNLVCQDPKGVTFEYNINFGHSRYHYKGLTKKYTSQKFQDNSKGYGVP